MKEQDGYTEIQVNIFEDDVAKVIWNAEKAEKLNRWIKEKKDAEGEASVSFGLISKAVEATGASCSRAQVQKLAENRTPEVYYDVAKAIAEYFGHTYGHLGKVLLTARSK